MNFNQKDKNSPYAQLKFSEIVKSPYGKFEVDKYLYETKLQNIYDDYKKNIDILSQSEKRSLQDAYYIRELSRKYLGEYASNVGVGDVSGRLLDIYSNYIQNIDAIRSNYAELRTNFEQAYQQERFDSLAKIMEAQYGIEAGKLDEKVKTIMFNIIRGDIGDHENDFDYLESYRDEIGIDNYHSLYGTLYTDLLDKINYDIENQFFGYKINEQGERELIADEMEYLEQYQDILSPQDFKAFMDKAQFRKELRDALNFTDIMSPDSPHYVGRDYNFSLLTGEDVDATSIGIMDSRGNRYFSVIQSIDEEKQYIMTSEELFDIYAEEYEKGLASTRTPVNGSTLVVPTKIVPSSKKGVYSTQLITYVFKDGSWHRLVPEKPITPVEMSYWTPDRAKSSPIGKVKIKKNTFTIERDGRKETFEKSSLVYGPRTKEYQNLMDEAIAIHGTSVPDRSLFLYEGRLFMYDDGKFYQMQKKG